MTIFGGGGVKTIQCDPSACCGAPPTVGCGASCSPLLPEIDKTTFILQSRVIYLLCPWSLVWYNFSFNSNMKQVHMTQTPHKG